MVNAKVNAEADGTVSDVTVMNAVKSTAKNLAVDLPQTVTGAMVAARIANLDKHSFRGNQSVTANLQEATTRAKAAEQLNVSEPAGGEVRR